MRKIGLLGGMSWESSIEYERLINTGVRDRLGGTASADLMIRSYNFAEIEALQEHDDWASAGRILARDAAWMETSGAEAIVLCTNTMHKVADVIESAIAVPLIHIADATANAVHEAGVGTVAVMGTRYTMEQDFYTTRLSAHGLETIIPDEPDRTMIHDVIFAELVRGEIVPASRQTYIDAVDRLADRGAEGVIAGCTEIELLIGPDDVSIPLFPTTAIHAAAAVDFALG
jgi:aspartate racemase